MKMEKKTPLNILICDDDPGFHKLVQSYLRSADDNFVLEEAGRKGEIQDALDKGEIDLILLDILIPDKSGIDWLAEIVEREIAPEIILTGFGSEEIAVRSIYEGAIDYLPKDHLTRDKLLGTVKVAVERWKRKRAEADRERFLKELERKNSELQITVSITEFPLQKTDGKPWLIYGRRFQRKTEAIEFADSGGDSSREGYKKWKK
jgi:DNA-binding response OmpR family regulator